MSAIEWIAQIDPTVKALTSVLGSIAALWTTMGVLARRRERKRNRSDDSSRSDGAEHANDRLFEILEPRLRQMEARCDECELSKDRMRIEFLAEMKLMKAQYLERITALTAEIVVLRNALRAAGQPIPDPPLFSGSTLADEPWG